MVEKTIESNKEAVILVHGTFAGNSSDYGPRWWQRNSEFWCSLASVLPEGVEIQTPFHWENGPNSYRERVRAGKTLLDRLLLLEEEGRGYHLIGHSHGGSVIWECLCQATFESINPRRKDRGDLLTLPNLRSWTTVGTPFIEYVPKAPFWHLFAKHPTLPKRGVSGIERFFNGYMIFAFNIFQVVIGISIFAGIIDILIPIDFVEFPLWIVVLFGFWVIFCGATWLTQIERSQAKHERYLTTFAVTRFAKRWLGIYSLQDEAISVLRTTTRLNLNVVQKREGWRATFYSDKLFASVRFGRSLLNFLYNLLVPWLGNRFISVQLASWALGNDRPGCEAIAVRTHPTVLDDFNMPIPDHINKPLLNLADSKASKLAPKCRSLLYSFESSNIRLVADSDDDLTSALVHNSYFDVDEIIQLIASHVDSTSRIKNGADFKLRSESRNWVQNFKSKFADHIRKNYDLNQ